MSQMNRELRDNIRKRINEKLHSRSLLDIDLKALDTYAALLQALSLEAIVEEGIMCDADGSVVQALRDVGTDIAHMAGK